MPKLLIATSLLASGCAEKDSIFHSRAVKPNDLPHAITVDAKQRHVLFNPQVLIDKKTGHVITQEAAAASSQDRLNTEGNSTDFPPTGKPTSSADTNVGTGNGAPGAGTGIAAGSGGNSGSKTTLQSTQDQQVSTSHNPSANEADKDPYKKDVRWRICAEAAPDVFSAFAMSLSGKGSADQQSFSAAFGLSTSETAATISRTQAINIIRESMYRTCERYLNGAINRTTLVTQAARDQRSMIAFLAIEQLTGAIRSPVTIISGPGTTSALGAGAEAVKLVADFRKSANTAEGNLKAAQETFDKANRPTGKPEDEPICESKDTAGKDADEAARTAFNTCQTAKSALADAKAENTKAQDQLAQVLKVAASAGALAEAATQGGTNGVYGGANGGNVQNLADAVLKIVVTSSINEALMFCIGYITDTDTNKQDNTLVTCNDILIKSAIESDANISAYLVKSK